MVIEVGDLDPVIKQHKPADINESFTEAFGVGLSIDPRAVDADCAAIFGMRVGPTPQPVEQADYFELAAVKQPSYLDDLWIRRQVDPHLDPVASHLDLLGLPTPKLSASVYIHLVLAIEIQNANRLGCYWRVLDGPKKKLAHHVSHRLIEAGRKLTDCGMLFGADLCGHITTPLLHVCPLECLWG